ncbi:MAG: hypothetical protein SVU32_04450 [Candidatus Nanohaloarchaea archaeon]|nr:hypothetical protein [Candidatus Nanohaloarchaea archaeon]
MNAVGQHQYELDIDVRNRKVVKTLRRSFKKAHHFLGGDFDPEIAYTDATLEEGTLTVDAPYDPDFYQDLYEKDAVIRAADDRLDEELYGQEPLPQEEIKSTIATFEEDNPAFRDVAELFRTEYQLKTASLSDDERVQMIDEAAELSAADFMLLIDDIIDEYGSALDENDLDHTREYLQTFQAGRDLMDDVLSIEEDKRNGEYNPLHNAFINDIEAQEIERLFERRFDRMEELQGQIEDSSHREQLRENTEYWRDEYEKAVKPVIEAYYSDDDHRQHIFRVLQK